jgi:diguanylate cyclase (GGDEF)-like protein
LDLDSLPKGFKELGEGLQYIGGSILEVRDFAEQLSCGDLSDPPVSYGNELAAGLKSLHASLLHITWQLQQIADGDYSQHVSFMGDFATAINAMTGQLDERRRQLEGMAYTDVLTGVNSRRRGMEILNDYLDEDDGFCLVFCDLDHLKYVNDQYSHDEGDRYIQQAATLLRALKGATICRLGGDEFMVLDKLWDEAEGQRQMEDLRDSLLAIKEGEADPLFRYSISFGVVYIAPGNTLPASEILTAADDKMYLYKRAHKTIRQG